MGLLLSVAGISEFDPPIGVVITSCAEEGFERFIVGGENCGML